MDIIPLLTVPQKSSDVVFELVIPSLPGYGFSQGSSKKGLLSICSIILLFEFLILNIKLKIMLIFFNLF